MMAKKKYNVFGMTCSACSSYVNKAVKQIDGVKECEVNLLNSTLVVELEGNIAEIEQKIKAAITKGGYKLETYQSTQNRLHNIDQNNVNKLKKRLILSLIFLIPLMYISMGHMIGLPMFDFVMSTKGYQALIFPLIQLILVSPIVVVNFNYFSSGFKKLFNRNPNMDSLIALGATSAIIYGIYAVIQIITGITSARIDIVQQYHMNLYIESAGTILTLVTLGKYLEGVNKNKTKEVISKLVSLTPKEAIVLDGNQQITKNVEDINIDDIVIVKKGMVIPVDGIIIEGSTVVDEAMLSGESVPVDKKEDDEVYSGTTNQGSYIKIKVTKEYENTVLSQIINLVENASNSKAPISRLADKVSYYFVPTVILIAIVVFAVHLMNGKDAAISHAIAVLVVSCPCALGLATPIAIMVGTGVGASNHILMKNSTALEMLSKINVLVFDKTGTLTTGSPDVEDVIAYGIDQEKLLRIVYKLEYKSEHFIGEAICKYIKKNVSDLDNDITNFTSLISYGVSGTIDNCNYYAGNKKYMNKLNINIDEGTANAYYEDGKTVIYVASDKVLLGLLTIKDKIREESKDVIQHLKNLNIETIMLTGDNEKVAKSYDLDMDMIISEVSPQEKSKFIEQIKDQEKKVGFIGDGINDAIALASSDVAISISSGSDIAKESADIILMKNNLYTLLDAVLLSKKTINNIKLSLFWAFAYNIILIPIAAGCIPTINLNPMLASLAMSLSSVCVVLNSLRIRRFKGIYEKNSKNQ